METFIPSKIIEKVNNLIVSSCINSKNPDPIYTPLHKGIIKLYFQAKDVEIDYENILVKAEIPITATEFTWVSFECQDIARFIKSCVKKDKKSLLYYQNVISYYKDLEVA